MTELMGANLYSLDSHCNALWPVLTHFAGVTPFSSVQQSS